MRKVAMVPQELAPVAGLEAHQGPELMGIPQDRMSQDLTLEPEELGTLELELAAALERVKRIDFRPLSLLTKGSFDRKAILGL